MAAVTDTGLHASVILKRRYLRDKLNPGTSSYINFYFDKLCCNYLKKDMFSVSPIDVRCLVTHFKNIYCLFVSIHDL